MIHMLDIGIGIDGEIGLCKVEFNQPFLLALFRAKFACNLAITNHVFRWESCKGSV